MDTLYLQKLAFKIAMILILIGALNWLSVGLFCKNPLLLLLGSGRPVRAVYIIVGVAALSILFYRDTYLPFLGETVMPCSALDEKTPRGADTEVQVTVGAGKKVLYWAAESNTEHLSTVKEWRDAYSKFENVGVVIAGADGVATLRFRKPQGYRVPIMGTLQPHVHYRVCGDGGMLERVNSVFVKKESEGFADYDESDVDGKLLY